MGFQARPLHRRMGFQARPLRHKTASRCLFLGFTNGEVAGRTFGCVPNRTGRAWKPILRSQETLTPEEFSKRYGWKNDPSRVRVLGGGGK